MRQFILDKVPDKSGLVYITGKDYRYLRQVLRVKTGDMINLRLMDGTLQNSTVASIDDKAKKILIQICANTNANSNTETITRGVQADEIEAEVSGSSVEYTLFQFIPKPQKFEQIVRQATECGVKTIVPVIGEYSEKSSISALQNGKKERLERIIREARQQSGSPVNTTVEEPVSLETAIEKYKMDVAFVLSERQDGDKTIREILAAKPDAGKIGIACGSEGGISPTEIEILSQKGLFYPIHFSVNILRCETAALYGIAAVQISRL